MSWTNLAKNNPSNSLYREMAKRENASYASVEAQRQTLESKPFHEIDIHKDITNQIDLNTYFIRVAGRNLSAAKVRELRGEATRALAAKIKDQ